MTHEIVLQIVKSGLRELHLFDYSLISAIHYSIADNLIVGRLKGYSLLHGPDEVILYQAALG